MKKVLFLAPFETRGRFNGGIASYAKAIADCRDFVKEDIEFIPFSTSRVKRSAYSGGRFKIENIVNFFKTRKALRKAVKERNPDSIYINTSRNYALYKDLLLAKRRCFKNLEIIIHIHFAEFDEVFPNNKLIRKKCIKFIKNRVDKLIVLSSKLKNQLVEKGFNPYKIFVLRNYFDESIKIKTLDGIKKQNISLPINYLFVGSLTVRKGLDTLLATFSQLDNSYQLKICGSSNDIVGDHLVAKYKDSKNIDFVGYVSGQDKIDLLNGADVFVLPTLAEGLPISILEAMAAGLGIITTDVGAIPEIVDETNGFIIKPSNSSELLLSIKKYHDNLNLLKEHKITNLEKSSQFSFDVFKKELISIVKQL